MEGRPYTVFRNVSKMGLNLDIDIGVRRGLSKEVEDGHMSHFRRATPKMAIRVGHSGPRVKL
jgi:hypothetical protein